MLALNRDILPLNIFFTLLLGVGFIPLRAWFARHLPDGWVGQSLSWLAGVYLIVVGGILVEYGPFGVLLIPGMILFLRRPTIITGALLTGLLVMINMPQATSLAAFLAIPLIYAVSTLKLPPLPRAKWFFYIFYPLHLILLGLLRNSL